MKRLAIRVASLFFDLFCGMFNKNSDFCFQNLISAKIIAFFKNYDIFRLSRSDGRDNYH